MIHGEARRASAPGRAFSEGIVAFAVLICPHAERLMGGVWRANHFNTEGQRGGIVFANRASRGAARCEADAPLADS
jgi:hypothetical protein